MMPPIFQAANVPAVQALLKAGNGPLRFYSFGQAPAASSLVYPYAVWRLIYGTPENYLGDRSDMDYATVQVDVYASSASTGTPNGAQIARDVRDALRVALEGQCYIVSFLEEDRDPDTNNWHCGFQADWWTPR